MKLVNILISLAISVVFMIDETGDAAPVRTSVAAAIPCVSQMISMCESISGCPEAARETQEYFRRNAKETMRALKYSCTFGRSVCTEQLLRAAFDGDLDEVKHQIEYGADVNGRGSSFYMNALQFAVENRDSEMTKYLVDKGANVNPGLNVHYVASSVLTSALAWGDLEIIKYLVDHGAIVDEVHIRMPLKFKPGWSEIRTALKEAYKRQRGMEYDESSD